MSRISHRSPSLRLLAVDDDELILQSLPLALPENWQLTGHASHKNLPMGNFDAAFVDMHLDPQSSEPHGLDVIEELAKRDPRLEIVAISGDLDRNLMEQCLKRGATRFLAKPLNDEEVRLVLDKIEALHLLREADQRTSHTRQAWIGESPAAKNVQRQIAELRGEAGPILIEGASGTGKEVVANWLHDQENRGPFITVNVAAIPETLFESELFGHIKGAFTGAEQNKMGLAEAAHNGDLFLDEVEALPLSVQAKLLRFLESGEIRRVGAKDSIRVNVRVIAATNQNLNQMVKDEKFREDLLWRLSGKKIELPVLRERLSDIPLLCEKFLEADRPRRNKQFAEDAYEALKAYDWPGNVRELKRVVEQLVLTSPLPIIRSEDVNGLLRTDSSGHEVRGRIDLSQGLPELTAQFEKQVIQEGLSKELEIDDLAKLLKISRSSLYKKIKDHNLETRS